MCQPVCNPTSVDCSTLFNDSARDLSNTFGPQSNYLEYHPESWWYNPIPFPCLYAPYESPVYIAALVLCPQNKWQYMEDNWLIEWIADAKAKVQLFWKREYKSTAITVPTPASEAAPTVHNAFQEWEKKRQRSQLEIDEYTKYLQAAVLPEVKDERSWWLETTQRISFPALSVMALDILSIPAMSAEPERLFSGAKITITDRRNQLGIESIQAIECLKSWLGGSSNGVGRGKIRLVTCYKLQLVSYTVGYTVQFCNKSKQLVLGLRSSWQLV
jgi:hypothetical protein